MLSWVTGDAPGPVTSPLLRCITALIKKETTRRPACPSAHPQTQKGFLTPFFASRKRVSGTLLCRPKFRHHVIGPIRNGYRLCNKCGLEHGTTFASGSRRRHLSRVESCQRASADLRGIKRLPGIRTSAWRSSRASGYANCRLLPHAQSLASGAMARPRWRTHGIHVLGNTDSHPAMACVSPINRDRPRLPRSLPIFPSPGRRSFSDAMSVRRAKRITRRSGHPRRKLAMVQSMASHA